MAFGCDTPGHEQTAAAVIMTIAATGDVTTACGECVPALALSLLAGVLTEDQARAVTAALYPDEDAGHDAGQADEGPATEPVPSTPVAPPAVDVPLPEDAEEEEELDGPEARGFAPGTIARALDEQDVADALAP